MNTSAKKQVREESTGGVLKEVLVADAAPWEMQPRKHFSEQKHKELVNSVRMHGVIQPLLVRMVEGAPARGPMPDGKPRYQIIAGERRWRAACEAGLTAVLVVVRELTDSEALELALVENLDRVDLDVFEEAEGYHGLVDLGWSVAEIADRFSKSREHIYGRLDIRALGEKEREAVREGGLAVAAARELAKVPEPDRDRALDEVLHPRYSATPLSRDEAVKHLRVKFVLPAEAAAEWEKDRKSLEKQFPKALVRGYVEGLEMQRYGSGWVRAESSPQAFEVTGRLRDDPKAIPTWGALAERYGAQLNIVPGGDEEEVVALVSREAVMAGDIANTKAGECVFPKPRGEEEERTERNTQERKRQEMAAAEAARKKQTKAFLEEMRTAGIEALLPALAKSRLHECDENFVEVYNAIHGTELNGWDEESVKLLEEWLLAVVRKGGVKAWLWLQCADSLLSMHAGLEFGQAADATGMDREEWPDLCEDPAPAPLDEETGEEEG